MQHGENTAGGWHVRVAETALALLRNRGLDPELAQKLSLGALRLGLGPDLRFPASPLLRSRVFGLEFPHPVGLAAGIDKDAVAARGLLRLGCASVEVGTLTLRPQDGNPKPRVFRLTGDRAVINRFGFNSGGLDAGLRRLRDRNPSDGLVGINVGANSDSPDRVDDYASAVSAAAPYGDYITVNISSPNTTGLRDLQSDRRVDILLERVAAARDAAPVRPPVLLKIAPDLSRTEVEGLVSRALAHGIDGMIIGNTTVGRPAALSDPQREEQGGLSGEPLFPLSTRVLAWARIASGGRLPLVGAGGVHDAQTAYAKIRAGADLVQLYTGLIFAGPGLFRTIHDGLVQRVRADGHASVSGAVGRDAESFAEGAGE